MMEFVRTVIAVLFGAAIAYWSHRLHERRRDRAANLGTALSAQFVLVEHRNFLEVLCRHLNTFRESEHRHVELPHLNHDLERPRIDTTALGFMLQSSKPDLLNELSICNSRFFRLIGAISERGKHLESRVLDFIGEHCNAGDDVLDPNDWRLNRLKKLTDSVYEAAFDALETNKVCFEELSGFVKIEFPKSKTLSARILHPKKTKEGDSG